MDDKQNETIGKRLRELIRNHCQATGRPYRHLSRAIGMKPNYIASFLCRDPASWSIPKHPTLSLLLFEIGAELDDLNEPTNAKSKEVQ